MISAQQTSWDARVVSAIDLSVKAYIPRWTSLEFSDQLDDVGSGKITIDFNDSFIEQFEEYYGAGSLFSGAYAIQILRQGQLVFTFLIEDTDVQRAGYNQETAIAGRGIGAQLDWAIVLPYGYSDALKSIPIDGRTAQLLDREFKSYQFFARLATTANLSATYGIDTSTTNAMLTATSNGSITASGIDGVTDIEVGDVIVVKNQTNNFHNGIYSVYQLGDGSSPWKLQRVSNFSYYDERYCYVGSIAFVHEGNTNKETKWQLTACPSDDAGFGTVPITFSAATSAYTAISAFYILFNEANSGNELITDQGSTFGDVRSGYGRGGSSNKVSWALSLESTYSSAKGKVDSKGSIPKDGGILSISKGTTLLEAIGTIAEKTECNWHVSPSGVISIARKPNNTYSVPFGTDRGFLGANPLMIPLPHSTTSQTKTTTRETRSTVFGTNSFLMDSATDEETKSVIGRREQYYEDTSDEAGGVTNITTTALAKVSGAKFSIDIELIETDGRRAFLDFSVGDKILIEYTIGQFVERIVSGISTTLGADNIAQIQLTLNDVIPDSVVSLQDQSIYGTHQAAVLKSYINKNRNNPAAPVIRIEPVATVTGMSNKVAISWDLPSLNRASAYDAYVYRTQGMSRVSSISRVSSVATLTTTDGHAVKVGDIVTISGCGTNFDISNAIVTEIGTPDALSNIYTYKYADTRANGTFSTGAVQNSLSDAGIKVTNATRKTNLVTITTARAHGFTSSDIGKPIITTGFSDTTLDVFGSLIYSIPSTTTFCYINTGPDTSESPSNGYASIIIEMHVSRADSSSSTVVVEGLSLANRNYQTAVIPINSAGDPGTPSAPKSFISSNEDMVIVGSGIKSPNYITGSTGWRIGSDGSAELSNVVVRGNITGSTVDIPNTISPYSFHVDQLGNLWSGSASYSSAPFKVSNTGALTAGGSGNTSFHVNESGDIWSGNTSYSSAPFKVYRDGTLYASGASISGAITSSSIDIGSENTSFHVNTSGQHWAGHANYASAPFKVNNDGSLTATSASISGSVTASTITGSTVTVGTFDGSGTGLQLTSDGYIQGSGSGVRIKNWDGTTGTQLFAGSISTSTLNADLLSINNGTEYFLSDIANGTRIRTSNVRPLVLYRNYVAGSDFIRLVNTTNGSEAGRASFTSTTSVTWSTTSDARMKENVINIENPVQLIKQLNPVKFNFIGDSEHKITGFLAQEVYDVLPHVVSVGGETVEERPWSLDYAGFTPILTAALKELIARIEILESKK